ncbi:MAG: hypothetical protein JWQ83_607 [Lacunisphaera sp.]|nr:hypothetical protein [Lacunisphaera sp.]MDB6165467.1 hypothetical protein [Lacunisphaera sp.]
MRLRPIPFLTAGMLFGVTALAQPAPGLAGRIDGEVYTSATGEFSIPLPVLKELGGTVTDTENVVTFGDSYNTHISIACFPQDAAQNWELETRGRRDYLLYFFTNFVLADFTKRFPGSRIESARFMPEFMEGALIAYALLPGGSFFEGKNRVTDAPVSAPAADPVVAKRGTMLFVRRGFVYVVSTELAERATQRSTYQLTTEKENTLLSERLTALAGRLVFPPPKPRAP